MLFGWLHFPDWITIGGEAQGALQWHFFGMWILAINGIAYLIYGLVTGRFRRMLLPIRLRELIATVRDALRLHLAHDDLTRYNAVQRSLYVGIILVGILQVISGLVVWKPMQFSELTTLFYDFQGARLVHFLGMAAIVLFLLVHVALALLVPRTLVAMVTGGPELDAAPRAVPPAPALPTPRRSEKHRDKTCLIEIDLPAGGTSRSEHPRRAQAADRARSTAAAWCAARSASAP